MITYNRIKFLKTLVKPLKSLISLHRDYEDNKPLSIMCLLLTPVAMTDHFPYNDRNVKKPSNQESVTPHETLHVWMLLGLTICRTSECSI